MTESGEEGLRDVNTLDAARLALRGALATIHDLQELCARLKAEGRDEAARRRAAEATIAEQGARLEEWRERAEKWEEDRTRRAAQDETWKNAARLEARAEEKARIEAERLRADEMLARLRAEIEEMASLRRKKEEQWGLIKKKLEEREVQLLVAEREKLQLANHVQHDAEMLQRLRERRDREIAAALQARELELEDKKRELLALKDRVAELEKAAAAAGRELEAKAEAREEAFLRELRAKEQALREKYSRREAELQSSWAELENGLWQRAREARAKLDAAAEKQLGGCGGGPDEALRKAQELEAEVRLKAAQLVEEQARKAAELERRYEEKASKLAAELGKIPPQTPS